MSGGSRFDQWLFQSWPGDRYVYHTGHLIVDRWHPSRHEVDDNAEAAWSAYREGLVVLVQRRLDDNLYEYIAVRLPGQKRRRR